MYRVSVKLRSDLRPRMDSSALGSLNLYAVVHGRNVNCFVIHLQCLFLSGNGIDLRLKRSIDNPVHSLTRVLHEETDGSSKYTAWKERQPDNLVGVSLGLVECGEAGTEDLSVDAGDLVEALAREVEADKLANVGWVETERKDSTNCADDVSIDWMIRHRLCHLLIASGI
jgi:hypothetical protein